MSAAFENGEDFSPIAEGMEPIAFVFHDVAIAIDEKGTEAAAATAVVFGGDDGGDEPEPVATMVVDRTFYLAIRDREFGAVLFFARIGELGGG
jgi:serpin B